MHKSSKTKNRDHKSRFFFLIPADKKGFTLIEILVAMFLMAMVIVVVLTGGSTGGTDMDETLSNLERSVRFGADEAALRNVVTRINFELLKEPQEFSVQFGPNSQFIPPPTPKVDPNTLTGSEKEEFEKQTSELSGKFNRIKELQEETFKVYEPLKIVGVGFGLSEQFLSDGEASIYLYPTGEKDHALIILADDIQITLLSVNPYNMDFERDVYPIQGEPEWRNILSQAEGHFQEWLQKK